VHWNEVEPLSPRSKELGDFMDRVPRNAPGEKCGHEAVWNHWENPENFPEPMVSLTLTSGRNLPFAHIYTRKYNPEYYLQALAK
jgi:hypothetical protein